MDQTAQTDQVLNNFTNVNFYYSFVRLLLLFLLPYTHLLLLLLWWPWQLRLELSLTICALSAFHCFTPGQNTKNDYHFSDTSSTGLGCTFQWLLLSSMHCFNLSSCYACHVMFQITTSLSSEIPSLNQIKRKQPLTWKKYLCFCDFCVSDPAGRQCEYPSETWCLCPDFSPSECPDGQKKNSAEHGVFTQLRWQPPNPICLLYPLQYIYILNTGTCQLQIKWNKCRRVSFGFFCLFVFNIARIWYHAFI